MRKTTLISALMAMLFAVTFAACSGDANKPDDQSAIEEVKAQLTGKWDLKDFKLLRAAETETRAWDGFFIEFRADDSATVILPEELRIFFKVDYYNYTIEKRGESFNIVFNASIDGRAYSLPIAIKKLEGDGLELSALGFTLVLQKA